MTSEIRPPGQPIQPGTPPPRAPVRRKPRKRPQRDPKEPDASEADDVDEGSAPGARDPARTPADGEHPPDDDETGRRIDIRV